VEDLLAEFERTGSTLKVVRAFAETGRLFPQRAWAGAWARTIKWGKLTHARVAQALKNPTYAGAPTFGKTREVRRVLPDGTVRSTRRKQALVVVLIEDHHEGYVLWQEFLVTEAKLAANNTKRGADRCGRAPPCARASSCAGHAVDASAPVTTVVAAR
jgi:hypothetical protein